MNEEIRRFEELACNSHPALQTLLYDGWVLRFAEGYTGRANSVSLLYPSSLPYAEKIAFCEAQYFSKGLPCRFKLTSGADPALDALLDARGYEYVTPTDEMTAPISGFVCPESAAMFSAQLDKAWLDAFARMEGLDAKKRASAEKLFRAVASPVFFACMEEGGQIIACATVVLEGGYAGIADVVVDEAYRGRGYGQTLCRALLAKAAAEGAHTAYLCVVQKNPAARHIYEKFGFRKIYSYWYRVKTQKAL